MNSHWGNFGGNYPAGIYFYTGVSQIDARRVYQVGNHIQTRPIGRIRTLLVISPTTTGTANMKTERRAIRITEVKAMTGMGRSTIYKMELCGQFPRRFKVSERLSVWFADEVSAWLERRAAETRP